MIEVVAPGIATTVQDLGRPGYAHVGVSPSGMVDPSLGSLVNRLVGNPDGAALFETCGGLILRAQRPVLLATSAELAPFTLGAGAEYRLAAVPSSSRLWHYVAARGGLAVEAVLGSRSTDTMAGIGPPPVVAGQRLPLGVDPQTELALDVAPLAEPSGVARLLPGPRADWFAEGWQRALDGQPLTVGAASRVGVRLGGAALERIGHDELPSEGLVRGAVQATPSGELVMMLADHPTTGGYPVIGVVRAADVAAVAQHRPGTVIKLRVS